QRLEPMADMPVIEELRFIGAGLPAARLADAYHVMADVVGRAIVLPQANGHPAEVGQGRHQFWRRAVSEPEQLALQCQPGCDRGAEEIRWMRQPIDQPGRGG